MSQLSLLDAARTRRQAADGERRDTTRQPCRWVSAHFSYPSYEHLWAKVRDVSPEGVGLLTSGPIEPDTPLVLELTRAADPGVWAVPVRVVHATGDGIGNWVIGCAFEAPLAEEDLAAFFEPA